MESMDITNNNIELIGTLFPNCISERKDADGKRTKSINFELLRQMLSKDVIEGDEAYEFTWVGKKASIVEANKPIRKTLRPVPNESTNWDSTENLYIEGDNLEVLKLLQESYLGRVKMIYIDPPYNTGSDSFIYGDNFAIASEEYSELSGEIDEEGNRVFKVNDSSNPRFHSDWCSMMYSRLILARNMLADDGVIFMSIDDNELKNLMTIASEVFGEDNYINTISLFTKVSAGASGGGEDKRLKKNMEYVLFYAKNAKNLGALPAVYKKTKLVDYIDYMKKEGKSFKYINVLTKCDGKEYFKTIKDGSGGDIEIYKVHDYEIKTVKQLAREEGITEEAVYKKYYDKIMTTTNAQTSIRDRVWEATDSENNMYIASYVPNSGKNKGNKIDLIFMGKQKVLVIWLKDTADVEDGEIYKKEKIGTYWDGFSWINVTKEGSLRFENGKKPIAFIEQLMELVADNSEMIVMDFFSGSGSTAHAVMDYNFKNNTRVKYIMVQLREEIKGDNKANKDYLKYLDSEGVKHFVTEIGKERIRRAADKLKEDNALIAESVDTGFRVFKLDEGNMNDVFYTANEYSQDMLSMMESNVKSDRTDLDLLFGCVIDWGLPLSLPYTSEEISGVMVHTYNDGDLIACFDENIPEVVVKEIAKRQPLRVVFRDSSFNDSPSKINVGEIFKSVAPDTSVKAI